MPTSSIVESVSQTDTELRGQPDGTVFHEQVLTSVSGVKYMGERKWIKVFNGEASADLAAAQSVWRDLSIADRFDCVGAVTATATNTVKLTAFVGVAVTAIPSGSYGWVVCQGPVTVTADAGGFAAGAEISFDASGDAVSVGDPNTPMVATVDYPLGYVQAAITGAATGYAIIRAPFWA